MKIRHGFVSNSSTQSFLIYGTTVDPTEFIKKFKICMTEEQLKSAVEKWTDASEYRKKKYKDRDWKDIYNEAMGIPNDIDENADEYDEEDDDIYESVYFITELAEYSDVLNGLSARTASEYHDDLYIGISPTCIGDNETGAEFKRRVEGAIKFIMCKDMECSFMAEAWRDG